MVAKYSDLLKVYYFQLKGDYEDVEDTLISYKPDINKDTFYNIATWVWLLQKQVGLTPMNEELSEIDCSPYIDYLLNNWNSNQQNIWNEKHKDIYLSNLSMAYAALLETRDNRNEKALQKNMTEIRDYVFDNLLTGGTVLSGKIDRNTSIDQTLAVIPYGLFSPEDLIIVEATKDMALHLEQEMGLLPYRGANDVSAAATVMMALYYLEKSEKDKALKYIYDARKANLDNELAEVLISIFDYYISQMDEEEQITHIPLGNENVYFPQPTERYPHYPTIEENFSLSCQIVSQRELDSVIVFIENRSGEFQMSQELTVKIIDDSPVYNTILDPLPCHGVYCYYFKAQFKDGKELLSKRYNLHTSEIECVKNFTLLEKGENSMLLGFGKEHTLFISLSDKGMNLKINQYDRKDYENTINNSDFKLKISDYSVFVDSENPSITLFKKEDVVLATHRLFSPIEWKVGTDGIVYDFEIHLYSPSDQNFYGFGERYNSLEQRGEVIDCYVYNQYRDQDTKTYIPIPFYMTNKGYGCFVNTDMYTKFDLAFELKDKCTMSFAQDEIITNTDIWFYFGDYKDQLSAYTRKTGMPEMVPTWALGPWMSSNNWDRQSIVEQEMNMTKKHNIPATVIVLEQWSDETTYYMFNDCIYDLKGPGYIHSYEDMKFPEWGRWPDPKGMIDDIHKEKMKLLLWQIPIQKYLNKQNHPLKDQDETYMIDKGYVVQNEDGTPYRIPENWFTNSLIMDFSNEKGKEWWFDKRQYLIDIGVDGFKTDGGEFVFGKNLKFSNGQRGSEMRNQYPNDYVEAYYNFAKQNNGITFSRAGYTGLQSFPAHWAGDERSTFDAFKRTLIAGINSGLSGITFWGWDLAGFNGEIPTAELFMRSSAMAAFCPIMQYHAESKAEFNQDRTPWNIAERTGVDKVIEVYRFFANVRMNLIPYLYQESKKSCETGIPLIRALMIEYPNDKRVDGLYDEYQFGELLLIAPVIEEGKKSRQIYLPENDWVDLWSDKIYKGSTYFKYFADVDQIPVFVRMNSAILFNVDETLKIGSSIGNDISGYHTSLCKIYCNKSFEQVLEDHLGNKVELDVKVSEKEINIDLKTSIENLSIKVIGDNKPVNINRLEGD